MDSTEDVHAALAEFDRCFASVDAEALAEMFTIDAKLLLLHREGIEGRDAILNYWAPFFADYDTSAWRTEPRTVEIDGDHAYVFFGLFGDPRPSRGRAVSPGAGPSRLFYAPGPGEPWRIAIVLNSHVRPVEEAAAVSTTRRHTRKT